MSLKDFKIGKQLGKGAFGSVCIVTRLADQKTYAMKQVKISSLNTKERENALNEIRILASLQHPNIVGYYEAFYESTTKTMNIVMEYADDGDLDGKLKQCIKSHRIFEESQMWSWIIQLLEGLKYLHDNKIIHRDLKCANLFLMKNGLLKIGDLNVSKLNKQKYAQTQTGTPYYCAPEIWEDKPYDYKCDIWSVGCILYELCTHHPPFRGTSLRDLYQNVMKGRYEPISNAYSSDLRNFIGKMLVLDPRKRPAVNDLLNTEIIKKKIDEKKNNNIIAKAVENSNAHANFIKTIKLPKNLNDINRALPKKRYKNIEKEMMENDEFETKKAEFFKNAMNDVNKNNNNVNNNQPINNFNKQLLINKNNNKNNNNYNNINNYNTINNNSIIIQKEQEEDEKFMDNIIFSYKLNKAIPPFLSYKSNKKFTIVLDLEDTLLNIKLTDTGKLILNLRPGLISFLLGIKPFYEIISFSKFSKSYSKAIINYIQQGKKLFDVNLYREHCALIGKKFIKDITRIGRDIKHILMVDDLPENLEKFNANGILIFPYEGEEQNDDRVLYELKKMLILFCKLGYDDIRLALKQFKDDIYRKITLGINE